MKITCGVTNFFEIASVVHKLNQPKMPYILVKLDGKDGESFFISVTSNYNSESLEERKVFWQWVDYSLQEGMVSTYHGEPLSLGRAAYIKCSYFQNEMLDVAKSLPTALNLIKAVYMASAFTKKAPVMNLAGQGASILLSFNCRPIPANACSFTLVQELLAALEQYLKQNAASPLCFPELGLELDLNSDKENDGEVTFVAHNNTTASSENLARYSQLRASGAKKLLPDLLTLLNYMYAQRFLPKIERYARTHNQITQTSKNFKKFKLDRKMNLDSFTKEFPNTPFGRLAGLRSCLNEGKKQEHAIRIKRDITISSSVMGFQIFTEGGLKSEDRFSLTKVKDLMLKCYSYLEFSLVEEECITMDSELHLEQQSRAESIKRALSISGQMPSDPSQNSFTKYKKVQLNKANEEKAIDNETIINANESTNDLLLVSNSSSMESTAITDDSVDTVNYLPENFLLEKRVSMSSSLEESGDSSVDMDDYCTRMFDKITKANEDNPSDKGGERSDSNNGYRSGLWCNPVVKGSLSASQSFDRDVVEFNAKEKNVFSSSVPIPSLPVAELNISAFKSLNVKHNN